MAQLQTFPMFTKLPIMVRDLIWAEYFKSLKRFLPCDSTSHRIAAAEHLMTPAIDKESMMVFLKLYPIRLEVVKLQPLTHQEIVGLIGGTPLPLPEDPGMIQGAIHISPVLDTFVINLDSRDEYYWMDQKQGGYRFRTVPIAPAMVINVMEVRTLFELFMQHTNLPMALRGQTCGMLQSFPNVKSCKHVYLIEIGAAGWVYPATLISWANLNVIMATARRSDTISRHLEQYVSQQFVKTTNNNGAFMVVITGA
jgi:hypothetical protein